MSLPEVDKTDRASPDKTEVVLHRTQDDWSGNTQSVEGLAEFIIKQLNPVSIVPDTKASLTP